MTREIEIRLFDHRSGDGELLAVDAVNLIGSFKDVTYRLTRAVAERPGLGRTDAVIESLSTVRVALRPGSTRVVFIVGDNTALIDPIAEQVDEAFWSIVEGLGSQRRPPEVSDTVADAVDGMVVALGRAAPRAEVTVPGYVPRMLFTRSIDRSLWQRIPHESAAETVLHGVLEMVDLRTARFRLRDIAGNAVDLHDVVDAAHTAHLVGEQVRATGVLGIGKGTQHHRMDGPLIEREESVESRLGVVPSSSLSELVDGARDAPTPPSLDISDDELDEFLTEIRA